MTFTSFAKLEKIGIQRPSLAPEGYLYWSKLYPNYLERPKRKGYFTTIRIYKGFRYQTGRKIPIYLDEEKPNMKLFDAEVLGVDLIKKIDIDDRLARCDSDMTKEELYRFLDFWYKSKYGGDPQLQKISMKAIIRIT